jgi:hypothetical protein
MEFDPSLRSRPSYRELISKSTNGPKCVLDLDFGNPELVPVVKILYRIKLLKDVMIRPLLDDTGAAAMNNLLISLQTSVCTEVYPLSFLLPSLSMSLTQLICYCAQIFGDSNYLKCLLEEINSIQTLEGSNEGILPLSSPLDLSRATTDSTILDFPRSQSDSSLLKDNNTYEEDLEEEDSDEENGKRQEEAADETDPLVVVPVTEEQRYQKLLRIRDCLGLLRELFFMSKQTLAMESRSLPSLSLCSCLSS